MFSIGYLDCQSLFLYISTVLALDWRIIIAELYQINSCLSTSESPLCLFPIKHHNIIDIFISYTLDVKSLYRKKIIFSKIYSPLIWYVPELTWKTKLASHWCLKQSQMASKTALCFHLGIPLFRSFSWIIKNKSVMPVIIITHIWLCNRKQWLKLPKRV